MSTIKINNDQINKEAPAEDKVEKKQPVNSEVIDKKKVKDAIGKLKERSMLLNFLIETGSTTRKSVETIQNELANTIKELEALDVH